MTRTIYNDSIAHVNKPNKNKIINDIQVGHTKSKQPLSGTESIFYTDAGISQFLFPISSTVIRYSPSIRHSNQNHLKNKSTKYEAG